MSSMTGGRSITLGHSLTDCFICHGGQGQDVVVEFYDGIGDGSQSTDAFNGMVSGLPQSLTSRRRPVRLAVQERIPPSLFSAPSCIVLGT